jgi:hypothetical protein
MVRVVTKIHHDEMVAMIWLTVQVHTHPTLCEVLDETFKGAVGMSAH